MCKNADNPCPGCKKHNKSDAAWVFFTDEERQALDVLSKPHAATTAALHP